MRFCLQCGAALVTPVSPIAPSAQPVAARLTVDLSPVTPRPKPKVSPTSGLGIPRAPVLAPSTTLPVDPPRPSLGDPRLEIDEQLLRKSFEEPLAPPGAVVCRFCRGALNLEGDFCEHCGAPVTEAAPPGALASTSHPAPPPGPAISAPEPQQRPSLQTEPELPAQQAHLAYSLPDDTPGPGALYPTPMASDFSEPTPPSPENPPSPIAPTASSTPAAGEHHAGFLSRFKGLFKKS